MVHISLQKFRRESGFLRGFHGTPLGHQRERKYLGHLSVNLLCHQMTTADCRNIISGLFSIKITTLNVLQDDNDGTYFQTHIYR